MQQLHFHPAWDKTISDKDRHYIQELFRHTTFKQNQTIQFTTIRQAVNYKDELLITVIIHNTQPHTLSLESIAIGYRQGSQMLATHLFQPPFKTLPENTSMPWTFIFPPASYKAIEIDTLGTIEIIENKGHHNKGY